MSEKSKGDTSSARVVKNPLLMASVTGVTFDDFPNKPQLLPAAPPSLPAAASSQTPGSTTASLHAGRLRDPKSLVIVGEKSNIDTEGLDEINLNTSAEETPGVLAVDPNANLLWDQNTASADSILSQAASSFSALPSVASSVFSTFSKRIYSGNTSRERTPTDFDELKATAQLDIQPSYIQHTQQFAAQQPPSQQQTQLQPQPQQQQSPLVAPPSFYTPQAAVGSYFQSPTGIPPLAANQQPTAESVVPPPAPPKLYSPSEVPTLPSGPVASPSVAQNTYRLAVKRKTYAPIPDFSESTVQHLPPPAVNAPFSLEPTQLPPAQPNTYPTYPTVGDPFNTQSPYSIPAQSAKQEERKAGGLFSLTNLVPTGVLQNLSGFVQSATGTLTQSAKQDYQQSAEQFLAPPPPYSISQESQPSAAIPPPIFYPTTADPGQQVNIPPPPPAFFQTAAASAAPPTVQSHTAAALNIPSGFGGPSTSPPLPPPTSGFVAAPHKSVTSDSASASGSSIATAQGPIKILDPTKTHAPLVEPSASVGTAALYPPASVPVPQTGFQLAPQQVSAPTTVAPTQPSLEESVSQSTASVTANQAPPLVNWFTPTAPAATQSTAAAFFDVPQPAAAVSESLSGTFAAFGIAPPPPAAFSQAPPVHVPTAAALSAPPTLSPPSGQLPAAGGQSSFRLQKGKRPIYKSPLTSAETAPVLFTPAEAEVTPLQVSASVFNPFATSSSSDLNQTTVPPPSLFAPRPSESQSVPLFAVNESTPTDSQHLISTQPPSGATTVEPVEPTQASTQPSTVAASTNFFATSVEPKETIPKLDLNPVTVTPSSFFAPSSAEPQSVALFAASWPNNEQIQSNFFVSTTTEPHTEALLTLEAASSSVVSEERTDLSVIEPVLESDSQQSEEGTQSDDLKSSAGAAIEPPEELEVEESLHVTEEKPITLVEQNFVSCNNSIGQYWEADKFGTARTPVSDNPFRSESVRYTGRSVQLETDYVEDREKLEFHAQDEDEPPLKSSELLNAIYACGGSDQEPEKGVPAAFDQSNQKANPEASPTFAQALKTKSQQRFGNVFENPGVLELSGESFDSPTSPPGAEYEQAQGESTTQPTQGQTGEDQRLQNFFNNPPPKENGGGAGDLNYDLIHNGLPVRSLQTRSLASVSNLVEPPSSSCSEFSELNTSSAQRSEREKLEEKKPIGDHKKTAEQKFDDYIEGVIRAQRELEIKMSSTEPAVPPAYTPALMHWFSKCAASSGKYTWTPFSHYDSALLETGFSSGAVEQVIPVEGGRYEVNINERLKRPIYWQGSPIEVRRCSWFCKGSDSKYVPYEEATAELLENEYKKAAEADEWHVKIVLSQSEQVVFHGPTVIVHFQATVTTDNWGSTTVSPTARPRVVKRDLKDFNIDAGESQRVDHLIFMVHGIGAACDLRMRPVEEVVDEFRSIAQQLIQSHYKNSTDMGLVGRIEVLPISWHSHLHSAESGIDEVLKSITLDSIPTLRNFTNDTLLDILFYTSPKYCQTIMSTVAESMNEVYKNYRARNPTFNGGVSLAGHSLGSIILFDLLCHQYPLKESEEENMENPDQPNQPLQISPHHSNKSVNSALDVHEVGNRQIRFTMGPAGTGQPYVHYAQLTFQPKKFFALGSPIGMFITVRGIDKLGLDFRLPTCPGFFNIFHPFDPVAYRIEALVNPDMKGIVPVLIPHHKGRKRMHLELKETVARVSADIKQRVVDTFKTTLDSVHFLSGGRARSDVEETMEKEVDKVLKMQLEKEQNEKQVTSKSPSEEAVVVNFPLGKLNDSRRIDYVLQEAPLEFINEYIFALSSHVCYWESEDTILFITKEIYAGLGISPDSQVPQQSMTIERPGSSNSASVPVSP